MQTKIISIVNQKGGVGKTSCTLNIGAGLTRRGRKVLCIDLDPQAHLTYSLGISAHDLSKTIYEVLRGEVNIRGAIVTHNGMTLVPSSLDLAGAELELSGIAGREFLLKEAITELREFDYILIDCPPSLGILTLNSLTASTEIYIPLQMEFLALKAMTRLLETIGQVQKRLNPNLELTGIIATRYDGRKRLNREVADRTLERFGDKLFKTFIRENISIAEAPTQGVSIFEYAPKSFGAEDYTNLCKEIEERGNA